MKKVAKIEVTREGTDYQSRFLGTWAIWSYKV